MAVVTGVFFGRRDCEAPSSFDDGPSPLRPEQEGDANEYGQPSKDPNQK
jgi:hypothetical protein